MLRRLPVRASLGCPQTLAVPRALLSLPPRVLRPLASGSGTSPPSAFLTTGQARRSFADTPSPSGNGTDSSFDVFQKLKDPPDESAGAGKRKPSDKVLRLVDEIMSLTLIEAADLCDICQEKLAPGDGAPIPGRMPFPHPMGMFGAPMAMPAMGAPQMMPGAPAAPAPAAAAPEAAPAAQAEAAEDGDAGPSEKKKEETKKEFVTVKLLGFETAKKIQVVKEVRAATKLGLKESKELVESAPKVIAKGIPAADAEAIREKLVAVGAEVSVE